MALSWLRDQRKVGAFRGAEGGLLITPFARNFWQLPVHIGGKLLDRDGVTAVAAGLAAQARQQHGGEKTMPISALDGNLAVGRGGNYGPPRESTQAIDGIF